MNEKTQTNVQNCSAAGDVEKMFAKKGKEIVRSGMALILNRLRFAKKYDAEICGAICAVDECEDIKVSQKKTLIDTLKNVTVMNTGEVLSLVTEVLRWLGANAGENENGEVIVTLDERVEKWAQ